VAFNVRIFGHQGTRQLLQIIPQQFTAQISEVLVQPYNWSQVVATNGATAVNSVLVAPPDTAALVMIEIPDGQTIRYEFNPLGRPGGAVVAGNTSPRLSGISIFPWTAGTIVSIVEAASFP
jgi:hypothetical protein